MFLIPGLGPKAKRRSDVSVRTRESKRKRVDAGDMTAWFNDAKYSDLTIKASGGVEFKVHRVVLASRCRFFEICCGGQFEVCLQHTPLRSSALAYSCIRRQNGERSKWRMTIAPRSNTC